MTVHKGGGMHLARFGVVAWLGLIAVGVASGTSSRILAQAPTTAAGQWAGQISLPPGPLAISVVLNVDASGAWSGTIDIPAQGAKGLALSNIVVAGRDVRFAMDCGEDEVRLRGHEATRLRGHEAARLDESTQIARSGRHTVRTQSAICSRRTDVDEPSAVDHELHWTRAWFAITDG
jgi:hypothetical protein